MFKSRIYKYTVLVLFPLTVVISQEDIQYKYNLSGGIGVNLLNSTSLTDYLNSISRRRYDDFIINPEFFVSVGYQVSDNYCLKLNYNYVINSFNIEDVLGYFENHLSIHTPVILIDRFYKTDGVILKLGAGIGYSYAILGRKILSTQIENFYSYGLGLKFDFEANTPFGDNLYGLISSDIKLFLMSEFQNSNFQKLVFRYGNQNKNLDLDFFSISLKFGLIYYF